MAQLHYANLTDHRPDVLMGLVFHGLKIFYGFLKRTKDYLEGEEAVLRLAWEPQPDSSGERVLLKAPPDRPLEPASTFRAFLDESTRYVYELDAPDAGSAPRNGSVRRSGGNGGGLRFDGARRIAVLDRDAERNLLQLEREPERLELAIRPNTWPLACQIRSIRRLQDAPSEAHRPLLKLFEGSGHADWPDFSPPPMAEADWLLLSDASRPGTHDEQRRFVAAALATPDFALLEGPPGSGKTTAICELALQMAKRGKRVLLCASTHVAVDNVLERLTADTCPHRELVTPVRVGDEQRVSERARDHVLGRLVRTERKRLLSEYRKRRTLTPAQQSLFESLKSGGSMVERVFLETANLVCGTTIGILQHPDIKRHDAGVRPMFDMLILDEASKTTFQEFLVPALLAKRWVIVGDPKQLSPYVDDEAMAANVGACLPEESARNACIDAFMAGHVRPRQRRSAVVVVSDAAAGRAYRVQCEARGVSLAEAAADADLATAEVVIGTGRTLAGNASRLPLDIGTVRAGAELDAVHRQAAAWLRLSERQGDQPDWGTELGWRLASAFDLRLAASHASDESSRNGHGPVIAGGAAARLSREIEALMPAENAEDVRRQIDNVRRVALPSILESLRCGFERGPRQHNGTALTDGLPAPALALRRVLLSTQHRMHPAIADFSHRQIYGGEALRSPSEMVKQRHWEYSDHHALWRHVKARADGRTNSNASEAQAVVAELKRFADWAAAHPRSDGGPWEAAVLSFYRGQELEMRKRLRAWTKQRNATRHFRRRQLVIELCTVDGFQGHEADIVLITFAKPHPTPFLECPNRLNVALTRARYLRVIVGDRHGLKRGRGLLRALAEDEPWDATIEETQ